jgi:hypothetical protein
MIEPIANHQAPACLCSGPLDRSLEQDLIRLRATLVLAEQHKLEVVEQPELGQPVTAGLALVGDQAQPDAGREPLDELASAWDQGTQFRIPLVDLALSLDPHLSAFRLVQIG